MNIKLYKSISCKNIKFQKNTKFIILLINYKLFYKYIIYLNIKI